MTARKGAIAAGAVVGAVLIALSFAGLASYTGSTMVFALFCICYLALAILMVPRPRPYVFLAFFAAFLLLGFWMKRSRDSVWSTEFVEPIGDFKPDPASGTPGWRSPRPALPGWLPPGCSTSGCTACGPTPNPRMRSSARRRGSSPGEGKSGPLASR